ncbi:ABC transporter substrate-binding protein [Catenuloplanes atrovinosus]|uniref:Aldouronate transport system substrate-binding protein n=1 Tax=Catenuloplanes atrovinosus TaxID=137266 RepID=A0AAE3YR85_9ACTN|nr:extracellular solute-binding protein [Catenuloplanes atrovinosus]MDR7276291.1 putative aldouronate transport system substrate-binding protein [Catenuloplanes atrovinosus]
MTTVALLAACGSSSEDTNLDQNRAGAMENYAVGTQFKATAPVTFTMLYSDHPNYPIKNDWLLWKEMAARTNVTITPSVVPASDYNQKRNLVVSAGDAPFIIPKVYAGQETPFVASGAVLPVSDYLDLMPHFKEKIEKWGMAPQIDRLRQEDGKFYMLPGMHEKVWQDYTLAVRTDVMRELNLQTPKTWDELHTVLKAMKARYPDSYPFSDRFSIPDPGGNLLNMISVAYGTTGGWGYDTTTWDAAQQKFVLTGAMPQYRDMLTYLHTLVAEGLLDPESFTQTDDQAKQKLGAGKTLVISSNAQSLPTDYRPLLKDGAEMAKIPFLAGPAGEVTSYNRLESGIMITAKARESENFVALMQFIDWLFYSDAGQEFAKWGVEGVTYTRDAAGKRTLADDVDFAGLNPDAPKHLQKDFGFQGGNFSYGGTTELLHSMFSAEEQAFQAAIAHKQPIPVPPPAPLSEEEREQVTLWETPLDDYVTQQTLRFILGQRDLAEWDAYVAELAAKNGTAYVDMMNEARTRYADKNR